MHRASLALLMLFLVGGCDDEPTVDAGGDDAALGPDAGPQPDAGSQDAGGQDAGARDAGPTIPTDPPAAFLPFGEAAPAAPDTALPEVAALYLRAAEVIGDTVTVDAFAVEGAADYRIYPLPSDADITREGERVFVENATYRCAGNRYAYGVASDDDATEANHLFGVTTVVRGEVEGYDRSGDDATLGYVALTPGEGQEALYAVGSPFSDADHAGEALRSPETRVRLYVQGPDERARFLDAGWRDDGLVGYVPTSDAGGTHPVFVRADATDPDATPGGVLYYAADAEHTARSGVDAFQLYDEPAEGRAELGRIHYRMFGDNHDVLVAGPGRVAAVQRMGAIPRLGVQWPNATAGQILVVEALDAPCPFQGVGLADGGEGAQTGDTPLLDVAREHAAMRADAAHGEVFVHGEGPAESVPQPIARTFLRVTPGTDPVSWTFEERFDGPAPWAGTTGVIETFRSPIYDYGAGSVHFALIDAAHFGIQDGELLVSFMDWAADVNGKFRITPETSTPISDASMVHATMEVDFFSSNRRYPQLFITDNRVARPIQDTDGDGQNLAAGAGILVQGFTVGASALQVQVCDERPWDVNNQCPRVELEVPGPEGGWPSMRPLTANAVNVQRSRLDVFASTERVYVFMDGRPYGCVDFPADFSFAAGDAHVTYGHVLYHSGVDLVQTDGAGDRVFPHHYPHRTMTSRHFDNLAFRSTESRPAWPATMACRSDFL